MRFALILAFPAFLAACDTPTGQTSPDGTGDVQVDYAFGRQLRDRCATTNDVSDCQKLLEFDKGLAGWDSNGHY